MKQHFELIGVVRSKLLQMHQHIQWSRIIVPKFVGFFLFNQFNFFYCVDNEQTRPSLKRHNGCHRCSEAIEVTYLLVTINESRRPTSCCCCAKRDITHPTTTVVYNACYHLLRKRSCITLYRLTTTTVRHQPS